MKQKREMAKMRYAVLTPDQFDDHNVIAMIEKAPTFTRAPRFNEELKKVSSGGNPNAPSREKEVVEVPNTRTISFGSPE